jgi:hypothetical protein
MVGPSGLPFEFSRAERTVYQWAESEPIKALIGTLRTLGSTGAYFVFCKMMKGKMMKRAMILPPMILQEQAGSDLRNIPI